MRGRDGESTFVSWELGVWWGWCVSKGGKDLLLM